MRQETPEITAAPQIRLARPGDVDALLALQAAYYAEDGYPFDAGVAAELWQRLFGDPELGLAWAFDAAGTLVGYVILTLGYSFEYRGRDAFVDELYVSPAWRGRGLARAGLAALEAACQAQGVRALHLEVEPGKPAARALYRQRGFVDHARTLMTKHLG
jgi:GNAT superfamily N-acetyltransferase